MSDFLNKFLSGIVGSLMQFGIKDAIDILLIAVLIYYLLILTKQTRAMQVLRGLGFLLIASSVSALFNLKTISWVLAQTIQAGAILLVVLFQPEMRRALERLGRGSLFSSTANDAQENQTQTIKELINAMLALSSRQVGSLIVIEQTTGFADIVPSGTKLDAQLSAPLIEQIFEPNTPLHDGAMIVSGERIVAAGCFLPLSDSTYISRQLGTRHRAAIGISEVSDCYAFIVSEETGVISVAHEGKLTRFLDEKSILEILGGLTKTSSQDDDEDQKPKLNHLRNLLNKSKNK